MYEVGVGQRLAQEISDRFGPQRSVPGGHSEWDFWTGPLAAALIGFRDFDALLFEDVPAIRSLHLVDPLFGALAFIGVLLVDGIVEIAACADDPDYWDLIADDPDE